VADLARIWRFVLTALIAGIAWSGSAWAAEGSVVRIEATVQDVTEIGSGFVVRIEGDAAYIATAAHVVEGDPAPRVFFRARPHTAVTARVIAQEGGEWNGLALLRVDSGVPPGIRALPMEAGGGADLRAEQPVKAVGIPASIGRWAVLPGAVVSFRNRSILFSGGVEDGNSGGPLLAGSAVVGIVMRAARFGEAVPAISLRIFLRNNGVSWASVGDVRGPAPKPGDTFRDCDSCPEMGVIPAGSFRMGSPTGEEGREADEGPVHRVGIAEPFALATREVTVGEFRAFVEATGYRTEAEKGKGCAVLGDAKWEYDAKRNWRAPGFAQEADHPVVCLSWNDVHAYLKWLSNAAKRPYRLPSEAEWEYAARARTKTARFWGERPDQACAYANVSDKAIGPDSPKVHDCNDKFVYTAPVGSYRANAFGLKDMLGNVWEWTEDCYNDSYNGAPGDGGAWSSVDCEPRVVRGGSWYNTPDAVRSAYRDGSGTGDRGYGVGFRAARSF